MSGSYRGFHSWRTSDQPYKNNCTYLWHIPASTSSDLPQKHTHTRTHTNIYYSTPGRNASYDEHILLASRTSRIRGKHLTTGTSHSADAFIRRDVQQHHGTDVLLEQLGVKCTAQEHNGYRISVNLRFMDRTHARVQSVTFGLRAQIRNHDSTANTHTTK